MLAEIIRNLLQNEKSGQKKALYNVEGKRETSMHQPDIDGERLSP
jgi:hypothetical protein